MKSFIKQHIPVHLYYVALIYVVGILFFTIFRLILFFTQLEQILIIPEAGKIFFNSFMMGLRFDTVISAYILFFPLLLLSILTFFKKDSNTVYKVLTYLIVFSFWISFLICATDIPYFNYFFTRLTTGILTIMNDFAFSFEMILREPSFLIYFFVLIGVLYFYQKIIFKITQKIISDRKINFNIHETNYIFFLSVLTCCLTILSARGRLDVKSPIRIGTAYKSNFPLPNMLGLNPVFTFSRSLLDDMQNINQNYSLMNDDEAVANVKSYFNGNDTILSSPISRKINFKQPPKNYNIVLVILESMSADKMGYFNNQSPSLTPFLDKVSKEGIVFNNFYGAGIHTYNGLYSILTSFPSLMKKHTLKDVVIRNYSGLPKVLFENNYQTIFLVSHDSEFDNMGGFMRANNFQKVFSDDNYPSKEILSNLGVPDHYLFKFGLNEINSLNKNNKPFLAAFLTTSDHSPYIIPKNISFATNRTKEKEKAVEYVDWSIKQFIESASKESWFDNTIFVFTGDHGANWGEKKYELPLSYNHIPLIIYAPKIVTPEVNNSFGSQMDIFPTLMGILKMPYINSTMGIDLRSEKREFIYFSADDKIGCIDNDYYYINNLSVGESMFKLTDVKPINIISSKKEIADKMKNYSLSSIQAAQWLVNNNKTGYQK